jgi:hypothetical protein
MTMADKEFQILWSMLVAHQLANSTSTANIITAASSRITVRTVYEVKHYSSVGTQLLCSKVAGVVSTPCAI